MRQQHAANDQQIGQHKTDLDAIGTELDSSAFLAIDAEVESMQARLSAQPSDIQEQFTLYFNQNSAQQQEVGYESDGGVADPDDTQMLDSQNVSPV
jgi:hypothetical protein